ncbi:thiaminase II, partial [Haematococcus lacustris]
MLGASGSRPSPAAQQSADRAMPIMALRPRLLPSRPQGRSITAASSTHPLAAAAAADDAPERGYSRAALQQLLAVRFLAVDLDFPGLQQPWCGGLGPAVAGSGSSSSQGCRQEGGALAASKIGAGNAGGETSNAYDARRTSSSLLMDAATQDRFPALARCVRRVQQRGLQLLGAGDGRQWGRPGRMPAAGQLCYESPQVGCSPLLLPPTLASGALAASKIGAGNAGGETSNAYDARRTSSSLLMDAATQDRFPALARCVRRVQQRGLQLLGAGDGRQWGRPGRMPAAGQLCYESPQVARYEAAQHFLSHEGFNLYLA